MKLLLLPLVLLLQSADPRIDLVEMQQRRAQVEALRRAQTLLLERPEEAHEMGIEYLQGRLLQRLGLRREAVSSYVGVMESSPGLRSWALLRIAENEASLGHPELAAGLVTSIFRGRPPESLIEPALRVLGAALAAGGDCRSLGTFDLDHLPEAGRRRLQIARLDCAIEKGEREGAASALLDLLREDATDLVASEAAAQYTRLVPVIGDPEVARLIGTSLHHHRQFAPAVRYLELAVSAPPGSMSDQEDYETRYRLARSRFWNDQLDLAARSFEELAASVQRPSEQAQSLYQLARSLELAGDWTTAANAYRRVYLAEPGGRYASAALLSALRLEWRTGKEQAVGEVAEILPTRYDWRQEWARAALFLASSDIVRRRADRAGPWLDAAETALGRQAIEVPYWRGRIAELEEDDEPAVRHYLQALRVDSYHPLAEDALRRLRDPRLTAAADRAARSLAASNRPADLVVAWRLLGRSDPEGEAARDRLRERLLRGRAAERVLLLEPRPSREWPIWESKLVDEEEKLLALGLWREGYRVVLRHFPISEPSLALAASQGLAASEATRQALYIAEIMRDRVPEDVPDALLPRSLREVLYPYPYGAIVAKAASRHGVDPYLLLAIIREESRFDPDAVSPAAARGLTQFVLPTARRLAAECGLGEIGPQDLTEPSIAIELGAAYLAELGKRFGGAVLPTVAAYNAGERQTELWRSYCYGREPAEFYSKVGFPETRAYLARVLSSRNQYREIYADSAGVAPVPDALP